VSTPSTPTPRFPEAKSIFVEGRYRKLVRDLPQTVFFCPKCKGRGGCAYCDGLGKLTKDSVQELIGRVANPRFKARRNKFHGAGREDMDVRMLGRGRPFVLELLKSKRHEVDLEEMASEINRRAENRMEVLGLKYCQNSRVAEIKERHCSKEYRARLDFPAETSLEEMEGKLQSLLVQGRLKLQQRTPQRVAHRRGDLVRERGLEITAADQEVDGLWVSLRADHGTYIKEFISSDDGRTAPSLAQLLETACTCGLLDVLEILDEGV
jgi:tRNA pseudouridine synthase 10